MMKKLMVLVFILLAVSLSAQESRGSLGYSEWIVMEKLEKLAYVEAIADTWSAAYFVLANMKAPQVCLDFFNMVYQSSIENKSLGLMVAIVDDYYLVPGNRVNPVTVALLAKRK